MFDKLALGSFFKSWEFDKMTGFPPAEIYFLPNPGSGFPTLALPLEAADLAALAFSRFFLQLQFEQLI